jgi:cell division septation protein DedD
MRKAILVAALLIAAVPSFAVKTALDLMKEGRFAEAKAILDQSQVSPRYQLLYYALIEPDAARACSLYQVVSVRYPRTDCDSVAQERLRLARDMSVPVVPLAEVAQPAPVVEPAVTQPVVTPPSEPAPTTPPVIPSAPSVEPLPVVGPPILPPVPMTKETEPTPTVAQANPDTTQSPATESPPVVVSPEKPEPAPPVVKPVAPDTLSQAVMHPLPVTEPQPAAVESKPVPPPADTMRPSAPIPESKTEPPATPPAPQPAPPSVAPGVKPVTPELAPHDRPVTSSGHWMIQVGAFANFDNAHRLALKLEKAGYPVRLAPKEMPSGVKLLQVRVGGYATRADCQKIAPELKERFDVPTVIISE